MNFYGEFCKIFGVYVSIHLLNYKYGGNSIPHLIDNPTNCHAIS